MADAQRHEHEPGRPDAAPAGGLYEWLHRGMELLRSGDAAAAATLLDRAHAEDPTSGSVLEALARARFDAGQYSAAAEAFAALLEVEPASDYAHFGLGLSLFRLGRPSDAEPHLAMAAAMHPGRPEYGQRLREVRATRAARQPAAGSGAAGPGAAGSPADGTGATPDAGRPRPGGGEARPDGWRP